MADINIKDDILTMMMTDSSKKINIFTLDETLEQGINKILQGAESSTPIQDHYRNTLSSTGTADKVESFSTYGYSNDTLNWPLWMALYNDSWVFRRAIDKPAQDEVNCGFTLHGENDYEQIYKAFGKYKTPITNLLQWGALFGGAVAVMMFDTIPDEEMQYPLKKDKIKGARMKLYVTDRWYGVSTAGVETVTNMKDIDFGKPMYYNITFADGRMFKVHHSFVLRYEHRTAPQLIKNGPLMGWGYAEGSHILNELARDDQLKSAITSLINKCNIEVVKMSGMRGVFMGTDKGNEDQLRKRLEMVNWGRTYNSLTFLDKDDEYNHFEFSGTAGLSNLLEQNMWLVAAALEMQGILFGELKGGLSQDTDAIKRYAETIQNRCNTLYRPILTKLLLILFIMYDIDEVPDFDFNYLNQVDVNNSKMESIGKYSDLLNSLVQNGIISKYQAAVSLRDFLNKGNLSIQFTDENMNRLKLEEEYQLLEAYRLAGKSPEKMLQNQFPSGMPELPEKLSYMEELNSEENSTSAAPEEEAPSEMQAPEE